MSSNLMDIEKGGENTPYESIKTVTVPHKKSGGQFGEPETSVDAVPEVEAQENAAKGAASAEKIRYGQSLSEQGFGGQTTTSSGTTDPTAGEKHPDQEGKDARKAAGYGGDKDMDREIGA